MVKIQKLDHINIRTTNLQRLVDWYTDILGMRRGDRPNFSSQGAWMYIGQEAMVHIVAVDGAEGVGSEEKLKLEHFAFSARGGRAFVEKLTLRGLPYRRIDIEEINQYQINLWDADGNHIHVDFPMEE